MTSFEHYFRANGVEAKLWLWEHTIYQVTKLFEEAERRVRSPQGQAEHCIDGWWRNATARINGRAGYRVPEETAVSEALVYEMENVQREFIANRHRLDDNLSDIDLLHFHAEAPRKRRRGIGRKAKPTDFRFYRSGLGGIDLRIEAKVLLRDNDIVRGYLSNQGLGRFSDPVEPYSDDLVGGMVAYTVSSDRTAWEAKISSEIASLTLATPTFTHAVLPSAQPLLYSAVPFGFPTVPARREVLVFHLVLELDCLPSARAP